MIKCCNIKCFHPGLIVRNLYIYSIFIFTCINSVNLSASKIKFIQTRTEITLCHLLCQCPYRTLDQILNPCDRILISCCTVQYSISVFKNTFFHTFLNKSVLYFFRHSRPFYLYIICFSCKSFHRLVRYISQIHRLKLIAFPL